MKPIDLGDRLLWPDGDFTVDPDKIVDFILKMPKGSASHLKTAEMTDDVRSYNAIADAPITTKDAVSGVFPPNWVLPAEYRDLDLDEYLIGLSARVENDALADSRIERLAHEIWLFRENDLDDVLRCLIYVVDTLKEKNVVWGVGRGSSCSSYLLYLIGLHSVDPVKYDIDITDFIRPGE